MGKETEQRQPPDQMAEEKHARFALRLYHIPERERLVAEVVIDHTVASGETHALIPLAVFTQQTGLQPRELKRGSGRRGLLWRLAKKQIIMIHELADTYSFQADNTRWTAIRRPVADSVIQRVLPAILAPGPDFKTSLTELGREAVVSRLACRSLGEDRLPTVSGGDSPPAEPSVGGDLPPNSVAIHHHGGDSPPAHINRLTGSGTGNDLTGNRPVELQTNRLDGGKSPPAGERTAFLDDCRRLLGDAEMVRNGALWGWRFDHYRVAVLNAYAATKLQRDRAGFRTSAARYATKCFKNELRHSRPRDAAQTRRESAELQRANTGSAARPNQETRT